MASIHGAPELSRLIEDIVKANIEHEIEVRGTEIAESIQRSLRAGLAGMVMEVLQAYSAERIGTDIIIRVKVQP